MPTAPVWVIPPYGVDTFEPYPDGPTIAQPGTYLIDQPTLDLVVAAANAVSLQLLYSTDPPPTPDPGIRPVDPFIRYDRPQPDLSTGEKTRAQSNMGGPFGSGGASSFYEVESFGTLTGVDDSALIQAALTASAAGGAFGRLPVRLRPGVTYRGKLLNPTGAQLVGYGSGIKIPNTGAAANMFVPTGAFKIDGGDYDGNKANTTDPGVTTSGCGVYLATTAGWTGVVDIRDATFHDFWWQSTNFDNTTATLHDAVNAPEAAVYLERVATVNCAHIGQRFTGIGNVKLVEPKNSGSGSHGMRLFLCRNVLVVDGESCDNPSGHGLSSLYCYDVTIRGGHYDRNGTTSGNHNGITIGGDSTSNVNMPGRFIRISGATCNNNGNQGLIFDASLAGLNALTADADYPSGRTVNDPVLVFAHVNQVTANYNGDQGVTVNSSQGVHLTDIITDHNVGHGIQFASKGCTLTNHHAWYNGQKPLSLNGTANWGDHDIRGEADYKHNTPDDTLTLTNPTLGYPSRFSQSVYTRRAVTAATTAKMGELLALDTTAGTFAVTLPEISFVAPGQVRVKWIAGSVAPTLALTGSDKINTTSGTTTPTFAFLNQCFTLESDPNTGIWTILADNLPLSSLDARYATLASPAFTGTPTAPTAAPGTNTTQLATTAFVLAVRDALVNAAPGTMDTLGEIATLLASDESAAAALAATVAGKAPLASPALTGSPTAPTQSPGDNSTKIATTAYADAIAALKANLASPVFTGNPTAPTPSAGDNDTSIATTAFVTDAVATATVATIVANTQIGNYTFVLADMGKVVEGNSATGITFTIPPNSSVAYPVGAVIEVFEYGVGQITIAAGAGVTLRSPGGRTKLFGQYSSASLRQRATDEWCLEGDITT